MQRLVMTSLVFLSLLSLGSAAQAHQLSGRITYYGGGDGLCGHRTASGTKFECGALTAAHPTLPFGTVLSVTSGRTGKTVDGIVVTDRGPYANGAFLDLSPAAARQLGCQCTHDRSTVTVTSMGDSATVHTRGRQVRTAAAAPAPSLFSWFQPAVPAGYGAQAHMGHFHHSHPHRHH